MDNIENIDSETATDAVECKHEIGVLYCSGKRESGEDCSHCANCGEPQ